jgi:hypothetical protein
MPPRYSYWTIIAGGLPTAFRAADREDILPTFARLKEKHPDAELRWFARGKLWDSPAAAREDTEARRRPPAGPDRRGGPSPDRRGGPSSGRRSSRGAEAPGPPSERRGRDWRPGGAHKDPRQKFKDAKKDRNQRWRTEKFERKRRPFVRAQGTEEPQQPPRPRGPNREPRPSETPAPTPPPRPGEPKTPAPTPERGKRRVEAGFSRPEPNRPWGKAPQRKTFGPRSAGPKRFGQKRPHGQGKGPRRGGR